MVLFKSSIQHISVNHDGLIYFPSGKRPILQVEWTSSEGNHFLSEWAPVQGVHGFGVEYVQQLLDKGAPLVINEIDYLSGKSVEQLDQFFHLFPYPLSFIFSLALFHHQSKNGDDKRKLLLSTLILPHYSLSKIAQYIEQGYRCLKIKSCHDVHSDVQRLKMIRACFGDDIALRIDLNKKFDFATAYEYLQRIAEYNLHYVEEPTFALHDVPMLIEKCGVKVALDESYEPGQDLEYLSRSKVKYLIVKASRFNNIYNVISVCQRAKEVGIEPIFSTCFESDFYAHVMVTIIKRLNLLEHYHGVFSPFSANAMAPCWA